LLEIGYGSGVFMRALAQRATELSGIDIHPHHREVATALSRNGVEARLECGDAASMPFESGYFDCVVAISSLEFIADLEGACREICRVLRPGGSMILVTPGHSPVVDLGLRVLTGKRAQDDYGGRREATLPTLLRHFTLEASKTFPPLGSSLVCLYTALRVAPANSGEGVRRAG
jgi:ubiquinone/menaquinone biosynthesis C-methylase UbiE